MYQANNYGYNPYGTYMPQRPMAQPLQQPLQTSAEMTAQPVNNIYKLNGKQVESIDVVKAMDIPLDGSVSYFPIADGSAIVSKQLQMDGTSKTTIFKPVAESKMEKQYITHEEMEKALNGLDFSDIEDIKDELKMLKQEIKEMKKKKKSENDE